MYISIINVLRNILRNFSYPISAEVFHYVYMHLKLFCSFVSLFHFSWKFVGSPEKQLGKPASFRDYDKCFLTICLICYQSVGGKEKKETLEIQWKLVVGQKLISCWFPTIQTVRKQRPTAGHGQQYGFWYEFEFEIGFLAAQSIVSCSGARNWPLGSNFTRFMWPINALSAYPNWRQLACMRADKLQLQPQPQPQFQFQSQIHHSHRTNAT